MDFVRFAVNFESSIYLLCELENGLQILRNLPKSGAFWLLGGVHGFLTVSGARMVWILCHSQSEA